MRYRKYYPTLGELVGSGNAGVLTQNLFKNIHWFDGTLTYTDADGNLHNYPNLNFAPADLYSYWHYTYENLRVGYSCGVKSPWEGPSDAQWTNCAANLYEKAAQWLKLNEGKFLRLVKTYGLTYDPISNYDLIELSGDAKKEGKAESKNSIKGGIVTDVDAPETQSKNYSTTYDNASDTRLAGRSTSEYNGTHRVESDTQIPIKRTVQRAEADGDGSTTTVERTDTQILTWDEITTPSAHDVEAHKLIRRGNIGTTTTQEMIEAERELAKQNIIEDFFKELNAAVMLQSWRWS